MPKKLSVGEIKAVAEAAINAQHAATAAKAALDADPENQTLKDALAKAQTEAETAKASADALSQDVEQPRQYTPEQIAKMKRKRAILSERLKEAGAAEDEDDDVDDDTDPDDDNRPVTFKDLKNMRINDARQTAEQMADAITDAAAKKAVKEALARITPSDDPGRDFRDAVAIASREKNNKVLEELGRKVSAPQHRAGPGAPPRQEGDDFEPTAEEAQYMKPPFNLTKQDILNARPK